MGGKGHQLRYGQLKKQCCSVTILIRTWDGSISIKQHYFEAWGVTFQPFLVARLLGRSQLARSVRQAKNFLQNPASRFWPLIQSCIAEHPIYALRRGSSFQSILS